MTEYGLPLAGVAVTLSAYAASLTLRTWRRSILTTPIVVTIALTGAFLLITHFPPIAYEQSTRYLGTLLGPACAALGVTLYRQRALLRERWLAIALGLIGGTASTVASAILIASALHLDRKLTATVAIKSVTAPVAVQIAAIAHVDPAIAAIIVVMTGVTGATIGPPLLTRLGVTESLSRGIALGSVAHGIGTAAAAAEDDVAAAGGSLAMCLVAIVMASAGVPLVVELAR